MGFHISAVHGQYIPPGSLARRRLACAPPNTVIFSCGSRWRRRRCRDNSSTTKLFWPYMATSLPFYDRCYLQTALSKKLPRSTSSGSNDSFDFCHDHSRSLFVATLRSYNGLLWIIRPRRMKPLSNRHNCRILSIKMPCRKHAQTREGTRSSCMGPKQQGRKADSLSNYDPRFEMKILASTRKS